MEQGLVPDGWMNRRLTLLEQGQARQAAYEQPDYQWNFRVSPSCPPSTIIHMRGGRIWSDPVLADGISWYVESDSYDLADYDDTGLNYTFSDAYYYAAFGVILRWYHNPTATITSPVRIMSIGDFETGAIAERAAYPAWPGGTFHPDAYYGQPLAIIIMRNNGNIAQPNQFMPIDAVNRGRSYIWRNLKVRFQV